MRSGLIYIIRGPSSDGEKIYIGQTILKHKERWNKYISDARSYKNGRKRNGTCSALYAAMNKYGYENYLMTILIDDLHEDDLDHYEGAMISTFNCVAPLGFNLKSGGNSNGRHCQITKDLISQKTTEAMATHLDSYRKHEESKGLPKYVNYIEYKKDRVGYNVYHTKLKRRFTISVKRGEPLNQIRLIAISKVEEFNKEWEEKNVQRLNGSGLPKEVQDIV